MTRTIIDVHILQTVPPSNVNRDDTGSPKTAIFGGVRRARVSSQAWKRATRLAFESILDRAELGVRTKRIVEQVAERIAVTAPDLADRAEELAAEVTALTDIKLETVKRKKASGAEESHAESKYLVLLSHLQLDQLAAAAVDVGRATEPAIALKAAKGKVLINSQHSVDLALFGRMVADVKDLNVDASCQVAHAISVHGVETEYDYFTAVDDAKRDSTDEDAGAGMIGTVEFNSSTLYRYATVDVDALNRSLGDAAATRRAVEAFIRAFATSMPTGKQNTFANRTVPDAVLVQVRDTQPVNLVGAFENPVEREGARTRIEVAAHRLGVRSAEVAESFGAKPVAAWAAGIGDARTGLEAGTAGAAEWCAFTQIPAAVGAVVAERLGTHA